MNVMLCVCYITPNTERFAYLQFCDASVLFAFFVRLCHIGVGGGRGTAPSTPIEKIRANLKNIWADLNLKTFFRDHTNLFLEKTVLIWKYFVLNIQADSFCPPPPKKKTVLLSYGHTLLLRREVPVPKCHSKGRSHALLRRESNHLRELRNLRIQTLPA